MEGGVEEVRQDLEKASSGQGKKTTIMESELFVPLSLAL